MNVRDLIAELSKYPPHLPVVGCMPLDQIEDCYGDCITIGGETNSQEVFDVKFRGHRILLECGRMV